MDNYNLIFVDCEGHGPAPTLNNDTEFEFGAMDYKSKLFFHGQGATKETFNKFHKWLEQFEGRIVFISDNPAYDWQFINYYFHKFLGVNPFGHSARRISDFYAGIRGNFFDSTSWKKWRKTKHDHNPVHDALGNVEAFEKILDMKTSRENIGLKAQKTFNLKLARLTN